MDSATIDEINSALEKALDENFITPYMALERCKRVLANASIFIPVTFLDGDSGEFYKPLKPVVAGQNTDGTMVKDDPDRFFYFAWAPVKSGFVECYAEIVTQDDLDEILSEEAIIDESSEKEDKPEEDRSKRFTWHSSDVVIHKNRPKKAGSSNDRAKRFVWSAGELRFRESTNEEVVSERTEPRTIKGKVVPAQGTYENPHVIKKITGSDGHNQDKVHKLHNILSKDALDYKNKKLTDDHSAWVSKYKGTSDNVNNHLRRIEGKAAEQTGKPDYYPDHKHEFTTHPSNFPSKHTIGKHIEQVKDELGRKNVSGEMNDEDYQKAYNESHKARLDHQHHDFIHHMDDATSQPSKHHFTTYRGLYRDNDLSKLKPGETFTDHAYGGTSLDHDFAYNWAVKGEKPYHDKIGKKIKDRTLRFNQSHWWEDFNEWKHVARIHVKPGDKGHYLNATARNEDNIERSIHDAGHIHEREFTVRRGTKYKVIGHSIDPETKTHYVDMHIHEQPELDRTPKAKITPEMQNLIDGGQTKFDLQGGSATPPQHAKDSHFGALILKNDPDLAKKPSMKKFSATTTKKHVPRDLGQNHDSYSDYDPEKYEYSADFTTSHGDVKKYALHKKGYNPAFKGDIGGNKYFDHSLTSAPLLQKSNAAGPNDFMKMPINQKIKYMQAMVAKEKQKNSWHSSEVEHHPRKVDEKKDIGTYDNPHHVKTTIKNDRVKDNLLKAKHYYLSKEARDWTSKNLEPVHSSYIQMYKGSSDRLNNHLRATQGKPEEQSDYMRDEIIPETHPHIQHMKQEIHKVMGHPNFDTDTNLHNTYYDMKDAKSEFQGEDVGHLDRIHHMDKATSQPLKRHMTVYRGLYSEDSLKDKNPGDTFTDHAYTGTSINDHVAHGWASAGKKRYHEKVTGKKPNTYSSDGQWRHMARIHLKPGDQGQYLDATMPGQYNGNANIHNSSLNHEREYTIRRGTKYKVIGHSYDKENMRHYLDLEVHSQPELNTPKMKQLPHNFGPPEDQLPLTGGRINKQPLDKQEIIHADKEAKDWAKYVKHDPSDEHSNIHFKKWKDKADIISKGHTPRAMGHDNDYNDYDPKEYEYDADHESKDGYGDITKKPLWKKGYKPAFKGDPHKDYDSKHIEGIGKLPLFNKNDDGEVYGYGDEKVHSPVSPAKKYAHAMAEKKKVQDRSSHHAWDVDQVKVHNKPKGDIQEKNEWGTINKPLKTHDYDTNKLFYNPDNEISRSKAHAKHRLLSGEAEHQAHFLNDDHTAYIRQYKVDSSALNAHLRHTEGEPHRSSAFSEGKIATHNNDGWGHNDYEEDEDGNPIERYDEDGTDYNHAETIQHMDEATDNPTAHKFVVYRGLKEKKGQNLHDLEKGTYFTDHGYTGTSLKATTARHFGGEQTQHSDYVKQKHPDVSKYGWAHVARIQVKPGDKGHYLDAGKEGSHYSHLHDNPNAEEQEFLLHRGTTFHVTHHTYDHNTKTHYVNMEIHHQRGKPLTPQMLKFASDKQRRDAEASAKKEAEWKASVEAENKAQALKKKKGDETQAGNDHSDTMKGGGDRTGTRPFNSAKYRTPRQGELLMGGGKTHSEPVSKQDAMNDKLTKSMSKHQPRSMGKDSDNQDYDPEKYKYNADSNTEKAKTNPSGYKNVDSKKTEPGVIPMKGDPNKLDWETNKKKLTTTQDKYYWAMKNKKKVGTRLSSDGFPEVKIK